MAEESNAIHYSDFIKEDGSIDALIQKLNELNTSFGTLVGNVKAQAKELQDSIKGLKSTSVGDRKKIAEASTAVAEYQQIYKSLSSTMTEAGKQMRLLQDKLLNADGATKKHINSLNSVGKGYQSLVNDAKAMIDLWSKMNDKERKSAEAKELLASGAQEVRSRLSILSQTINSTIKEISALRSAQEKLTFSHSEEGKALNELKQRLRAETAEIERAFKEQQALIEAKSKLNFVLSEEGKQLAQIQVQLKLASDEAKLLAQANLAAAGSYDQIKAKYQLAKNELYSMSETDRLGSAGQAKQSEVNQYRSQLIAIEASEQAAVKLERAQQALNLSISETGAKIKELQMLTSSNNNVSKEAIERANALEGSYDKLKISVAQVTERWKALSEAERTSESGEILAKTISDLNTKLAALDSKIKANVATMTELQKAEERLAFLRTDEGKKLVQIQEEIRKVTNSYKEQKEEIDRIEQAKQRLIAAQEKLRAAESGGMGQYSNENAQLKSLQMEEKEQQRLADLTIRLNNSAIGSYNALAAQYEINKIKLNAMSQEQRGAIDIGQKLEKETLAIYKQMIHLQEATGNYKLSVGNYAKALDGLRNSVVQVVRELPALTVSWNTFFLAISNNLPILQDEIQRTKEKNEMLRAEGRPTVSVGKQIAKALFSWQTVLALLLTALSANGKELIEWVKKVFSAKAAAISLTDALSDVAKELKDTNDSYGDNVVKLKQLQSEYLKLKTTAEKTQWIKDNKTEFEGLGFSINSVSQAENAFIKNTQAIMNAFKYRAQAAAASKLASEQYEKAFVKQNEAEVEKLKQPSVSDKILGSLASGYGATGPAALSQTTGNKDIVENAKEQQAARIRGLEDEAKAAKETGDAYYKLTERFNGLAKAELDAADIDTPHKATKTKKNRTRTPRDLTNQLNSNILSIEKKYQDSLIKLEDDEFAKRRQQALANYNKNTEDLKNTLAKNQKILDENGKNTKKLTDEQIKQIQIANEKGYATLENYAEQYKKDIEDIERDENINRLQNLQKNIDLRLDAVKQGSEEELKLKLQALDAERQLAIEQNRKLPKTQQQDENLINKGYNKAVLSLLTDFYIKDFDQAQKLESEKFNVIERSELQTTRFVLNQEKARLQMQISLAEKGALDWSQKQIDAAKAAVEGIDNELSNLFIKSVGENGLGYTLLSQLGFDKDSINALSDAADIIVGYLEEIAQAEVDAAQAAVDAAQERVDAAQSAYDAEIEARNNGYANNVATAKKELQQEKKKQQEKEKLLAQAQRRQEAIDTATQTSSLITASANIWSSMSGVPVVGPALAIAAIATMWTSFAVAKIKARQATAASDEYGEGGLEFLEGGSHASGNDIDLHTKNKKGRNMRAEGGEAMAIINKRNTRRYKKVLPKVIDSLNKGTFEEKYLRAFENNELQAKIYANNETTNIDLTKLEKDVEKIKKQGEIKVISLGDGTSLIIRKNVKRIIKN